MEASKLLAARAQQSTENMELITGDMHSLALRTKQETVSMRIITLVTLFFLPGTFISVSFHTLPRTKTTLTSRKTIMSTDIVKFQTDTNGKSRKIFHLDALQLFLTIALPMMITVFAAWYAVYWWINRKEESKRHKGILEHTQV
jgi:O-glycosyl hydrolase